MARKSASKNNVLSFEELYHTYEQVLPFPWYCSQLMPHEPAYQGKSLEDLWKIWKNDFEEIFVSFLSEIKDVYVSEKGYVVLDKMAVNY